MTTSEQEAKSRMRDEIRRVGLRATASRLAVLRRIRIHSAPLTHAEICEQLADEAWDKATLYRNLCDLTEAGLLRRLVLSDGNRFEDVCEHGGKTPVHFICSDCEAVQCLESWSFKPPRGKKVPLAMASGDVEVQIRGLCDSCASK